jgi:anti-sigma factor RsiW
MSACPPRDRLDAYLDGALAPWEAAAFERHLAGCAACAAEAALGRQLLATLHATPPETAPPSVLDGALARIAAGPAALPAAHGPDRGGLRLVRLTRFRMTVLALAASAAVAALAVAPVLRPRAVAEASPAPTPAEVARARADVERALGLVGEATRDAGLFLRDDVLAPHVAEPAAESVLDALGLSD